jgi:kynureninase
VIADPTIYLDGNSLGRLPLATRDLLADLVTHQWGERLVRGWGEGWIDLPSRIGGLIAPLIGASPDEVIVADSTSVNLFKLIIAALQAQPEKLLILTEEANFPSDLYVLQGCAQILGGRHRIVQVAGPDGGSATAEEIERHLTKDCALLTLSHTAFKSGAVHDMKRLTKAAHKVGALVLWDLSHSAGVVPIELENFGVDLAVGCTYKYLNGGPGAPAYLYVNRRLQSGLGSPIWGWFGQLNAFDFGTEYSPADGIARFMAGTPNIISLAAIEPGVRMVQEAGLAAIRKKSVLQTDYLIELWREHLAPLGVTMNSPLEAESRGSHVSLGHPQAFQIDQALIQNRGIVPDFRQPDNLRLGVAPLYTTFQELEDAVISIREILETGEHLKFSSSTAGVT